MISVPVTVNPVVTVTVTVAVPNVVIVAGGMHTCMASQRIPSPQVSPGVLHGPSTASSAPPTSAPPQFVKVGSMLVVQNQVSLQNSSAAQSPLSLQLRAWQ
jgi:hypothetical protein